MRIFIVYFINAKYIYLKLLVVVLIKKCKYNIKYFDIIINIKTRLYLV